MSDLVAFLSAIVLDLGNDAPRLVYADWLDENGQPERAEFIRLQCELANLPEDDPRRFDLEDRELRLLANHEADWRAELPPLRGAEWGPFERGFVAGVRVRNWRTFFPGAGQLWDAAPVEKLRVLGPSTVSVRQLARWPFLELLSSVSFDAGREVGSEAMRGFVESPHLLRLSELSFNSCPIQVCDRRYGLGSAAEKLERLGIWCDTLGGRWGRDLAESVAAPQLVRLRDLQLGAVGFGDDGARALAAGGPRSEWRSLHLVGNDITSRGAAWLAPAPALARLTSLNLGVNPIADSGISSLTPALPASLRTLALPRCNLTARGLVVLGAAPALGQLTSLIWAGNVLGAAGARTLAESPALANLRSLDATLTSLRTPGLRGLLRAPFLSHLRRLELAGNGIDAAGMEALVKADPPSLRHLDLNRNGFANRGAAILAGSPLLARLVTLALNHNGIGRIGALALANSPHLGNLARLDLRGNPLSSEGRAAIRERFGRRVLL